jgi:hypothetical protein
MARLTGNSARITRTALSALALGALVVTAFAGWRLP